MVSISIIVPMYNVEKYIDECIQSLLNQNIEKEIILIDDGSTDNTYMIAKKYDEQYDCIKLLKQRNFGQSSARNRGIKIAQGEYVLFCDSDDCIDQECLSEMYRLCIEHNLDILKTGWKSVCGNTVSINLPCGDDVPFKKVLNTEEYFRKTIYNWYNVVPWNGLFKLDFLKLHKITFPEGIQFEDNLFNLMVLLKNPDARVMQLDNTYYTVHISDKSTTTAKPTPKKIYDQLENIRLMNQFIEKYITDIKLKQLAKVSVSSLVFTMTSYYYRVDKKYRKEIDVAIPRKVLKEAITYPQSKLQKYKLLAFTYFRPILNCYEIYHMRNK